MAMRFNDTETLYDDDYAFAFPTSAITPIPDSTNANGSNTAFTTTSVYDYNTGLPTKVTNPNGLETRMEYVDDLLRPTKVSNYYSTTQVGGTTESSYGSGTSPTTRWVKVRSQIDATKWKEAYSWFDGIGRTIRSQSVDSGSGDVFSLTCYDNMGRAFKSTNPFRGYKIRGAKIRGSGPRSGGQACNLVILDRFRDIVELHYCSSCGWVTTRREAGSTVEALSELVGLDPSTVSRRHDAARRRMQNNTQLTELSTKALKQYRQGST